MITDPDNDLGPTADLLRTLYGLTARESAVAVRAARGEGVERLAQTLKMAPNTARSHLRKVFDKTDTHRQAELAWLLARLSG
jgi:DNA-binding CsgD family transcriptional regulator